MINAERFKEEINKCNNDFGLNGNIVDCETLGCRNCRFSNFNNSNDGIIFCSTRKVKWLLPEYKEGIVLSKLEYALLKYIFNRTKYRYIARDKLGEVFVYENEPIKNGDDWSVFLNGGRFTTIVFLSELFKFIKWSDLTATSIKDVLADCDVVDDGYE